jgi:preprotein translocase subunit YajC
MCSQLLAGLFNMELLPLPPLLQVAAEGAQQLIFLLLLVGVFVFTMVLPQRKRQKEHKNFVANLKRNDVVVTASGIHGRIADIDGDVVQLEIDRGVKMKLDKSSLSAEYTNRLSKSK